MPRHRYPVRHAGLAEVNDLVARLYTTTPDVAEEVRELLQAGLERRDGGIYLPPRLLDRVVSGPGEHRATLRDWIIPMTQRMILGTTRHATPTPEHGGPAHRHEAPAAHHASRHTSRHGTPAHQHDPVAHHASRHASRHGTPAHQHEVPVTHHASRHTSRHATPGHRHEGRRATPAPHHEVPVTHHAPRHTSRHATPGHRHEGRHGAPMTHYYEPVDSMGDQTAVPGEVLRRLTRPIVTQTMIDSEDATCVICQDDIKVGDEVMLLPCSHWSFHAACIEPWLRRTNTCPSCRRKVE
ncbi:hypothetical protein N7486_008762 [Penicillium sp. IBT 16267x]|nr:hypothetical protein N7486_008762 [Penicillium sp. IBT 16267x]